MANQQLERYIPMIKFISEILGPDAEVILYDVHSKSVYAVMNPFDDEMVVGSPMRSLEEGFLNKNIDKEYPYIVNYHALSKSKHKLKSATLFLKNQQKETHAILSVNINVERLVEMRDYLNILVSGNRPYDEKVGTSFYNSFDVSMEGIVNSTIKKEVERFGVEPCRLSQKEKLEIVRSLDKKGIFLVKGAIGDLAQELQTTETSIYRYLNKLANSEGSLE